MNTRFLGTSACAVVLAFSLTACGGGGGGGRASDSDAQRRLHADTNSNTHADADSDANSDSDAHTNADTHTDADADPVVDFNTAEYRSSNYSVAADAIAAYDAGATGKGVKIGIVDSGINPALSEFAGRIDPASGDVAGNRGVSDEGGHGTAVSAVAAAARNGSNTMGVAFDATIVSFRADDPGSCATKDGCSFYDDAIAAGIDAARGRGRQGHQPLARRFGAWLGASCRDAARGGRGNRDRHRRRQRRHGQSRPVRAQSGKAVPRVGDNRRRAQHQRLEHRELSPIGPERARIII